jgi:hypothetical protein
MIHDCICWLGTWYISLHSHITGLVFASNIQMFGAAIPLICLDNGVSKFANIWELRRFDCLACLRNEARVLQKWSRTRTEYFLDTYTLGVFLHAYPRRTQTFQKKKKKISELYEANKQTANPWVFEPEYPGKSIIFDGRTGDPFEQPVIIGKPYILKLIHQVDDKIHGRSSITLPPKLIHQN